jgi:hypothetical protein
MGFGDSLSFLTGNSTSNDKENRRVEREKARWEREAGSSENAAARNAAFIDSYTNPDNPNYQGPGYEVYTHESGRAAARLVDADANAAWKLAKQNEAIPAGPSVDVDQTLDELDLTAPSGPPQREPYTAAGAAKYLVGIDGGAAAQFKNPGYRAPGGVSPQYSDRFASGQFDLPGASTGGSGQPTAPETDRSKVDPLLDNINSVQQKLAALADETRGMSAAEAALHQASRQADLRAAFSAEQSQRGALGAARGARNRGDRALLERQAVGDASFIGQEAARTQAMQDVAQTGQLAQLRATEEDADRRFRADVLGKAADLGLNTAALEVDISKANLGSVTNLLNNQFDLLKQQGQLDLGYAQLDQQKAEAILGFTKDMATLQYEYDKLSVDDQNAADALLMQKYGIDQQTMVALKQIKEAGKMRWDQVLTAIIGGAGSGVTAGIAAGLFSGDETK